MAIYNCIVCKTQFEGVAYDWRELEIKQRRAWTRTRTMIDAAIAKKTGFQCSKCESWLCSAEEHKLPKKSFLKGNHFLCLNCTQALEFSKVILPEDAFPPYEQIFQDQLEPGEKVENYMESEYNRESIVTNRRFLYDTRPLKWELLTDILSVDMEFHAGGDNSFDPPQWQVHIGLREKPKLILLVEWLVYPAFGQQNFHMDPSFSWRKEVESIPRSICRGAGIPFSVPKKITDAEKWSGRPAGVVIEFYPKDDLVWPGFCASCCNPVFQGLAIFDELLVEVPDIPRHVTPMPPLCFRIPYCSRCAARELVGKKINRSVRGWWYNGFTVYLDFLNQHFADEFIRVNDIES